MAAGDQPLRRLFVLAGPSGVGKGTLIRELVRRDGALWLSISTTTRRPRSGEREGREYTFVDREEFERLARDGAFLEWCEVFGNLYGTPRAQVEAQLAEGMDVLLELDVQGAMKVRQAFPDAVLVFVRPPDRETQRRRLVARGLDDVDSIERRLGDASGEEAVAPSFDHVLVNDDLNTAVEELAGILATHRAVGAP